MMIIIIIVVIMDGVSGGAPGPPAPPPFGSAFGLVRRSSASPFGCLLNHLGRGCSRPPAPPRLLGLRPRAPLERFAFRSLSESSSVCGTPKNEIPIYISHARTQKERVQRAIPICILWIKGAQTPDNPPYAKPGLRPYTAPVNNIPGLHPHLPQIN